MPKNKINERADLCLLPGVRHPKKEPGRSKQHTESQGNSKQWPQLRRIIIVEAVVFPLVSSRRCSKPLHSSKPPTSTSCMCCLGFTFGIRAAPKWTIQAVLSGDSAPQNPSTISLAVFNDWNYICTEILSLSFNSNFSKLNRSLSGDTFLNKSTHLWDVLRKPCGGELGLKKRCSFIPIPSPPWPPPAMRQPHSGWTRGKEDSGTWPLYLCPLKTGDVQAKASPHILK